MNKKKNGLISSYAERMERGYTVRLKLLEFLRDETYTSIEIVCLLCGYSTKRGAEMMLAKMEKEGYIKSVRRNLYSAHGQKVYGITQAGYSFCTPFDEMPDNPKIFLPYRLNLNQFEHKIKLQKLRVALEKAGYETGDINDYPFKSKIPDLITVKTLDGNGEIMETELVTAYEMELTIKSTLRYKKIILDYDSVDYSFYSQSKEIFKLPVNLKAVLWITVSEEISDKLKNIFERIIKIYDENGRDVKVNFQFVSVDTIMQYLEMKLNEQEES